MAVPLHSSWTPNTGFPNGAADTATFNLANSFPSLDVSANTEVNTIVFSNLATNPYTINVRFALSISGTGITNSSGITHNFVTAVNSSPNGAAIFFTNSATAGNMTAFTNNGATVSGVLAGLTQFNNTSTADHATHHQQRMHS